MKGKSYESGMGVEMLLLDPHPFIHPSGYDS